MNDMNLTSPIASPAPPPGRRYLLITPCRDEQDYLPVTIQTVASQTILPACWVIVDDGSTDRTPQILREAAAKYPFIKLVQRKDRGERAVGPGVIQAFNDGLEAVDLDEFDYLCKLDGDLELPPRYFERLMEEMERDPSLGAVSGKMFLRHDDGSMEHERRGDDHAAGPSKFYRRACFERIGGFVPMVGWDGIDGHMCRLNGWAARSILDDEIKVVHLRQMGSSHKGIMHGRMRGGEGKWRLGSSPWYLLATAVYRAFDPPYFIGACGMVFGYFRAKFGGIERYEDPRYLRHLRRYEWRTLLMGKNRTTNWYHAQIRARRAAEEAA